MSSNYNSRPRAAEILVDAATAHVIRQRESVESLFALESVAQRHPSAGPGSARPPEADTDDHVRPLRLLALCVAEVRDEAREANCDREGHISR